MLFVLSGNVQTGKTRWLERLVGELRARGCVPCGVLAPGVWADRRNDATYSEHVDANGFEKLGIDNVLLPQGTRIQFARRADLAAREGTYDEAAQSAHAKLSWHISDEALEQVNSHFAKLALSASSPCAEETPGILIVDELGRLELLHGGGLTGALALLENGPTPSLPHALIVVRASLLPHVEARFESWGERAVIGPNEASAARVLDAFKPASASRRR